MAMTIANEGQAEMLKRITGGAVAENIALRLYSNNVTIADTVTSASFTEVANGNGYTTGGKVLSAGSWGAPSGSDPASSAYAQQTWTCVTAAIGTVYGYYLIGVTSGKIYGCEQFAGAPLSIQVGDVLNVTPTLQLAG